MPLLPHHPRPQRRLPCPGPVPGPGEEAPVTKDAATEARSQQGAELPGVLGSKSRPRGPLAGPAAERCPWRPRGSGPYLL